MITIDTTKQTLTFDGKTYSVSTAKRGVGEKNGSLCTPRGRHIVRAKIGAGQPLGAVFVRRRPSGEVWTAELHAKYPGRDWILTRILWLSGCEPGRNRHADLALLLHPADARPMSGAWIDDDDRRLRRIRLCAR